MTGGCGAAGYNGMQDALLSLAENARPRSTTSAILYQRSWGRQYTRALERADEEFKCTGIILNQNANPETNAIYSIAQTSSRYFLKFRVGTLLALEARRAR